MVNAYSKGSEWRKWDLQVQTYLDPRWTWPDNYPAGDEREAERQDKFNVDLVEHCISNNIAVIAITDHNTGKAIDPLLAKNSELGGKITVLPGVEIISSEGIHLVVIFNPHSTENRWSTWNETISNFLTAISMPQPAFHGENNHTPATANCTAEDIISKAREYNGITIFAHAHSTNGGLFCKSDARTRKRLLETTNILDAACELPNKATRISELTTKLTDHQYNIKDFAIINTSDSRKIIDTGSKFSWIKADPTFEGLKQIIFEPQERVKIQENNPFEDRKKLYFDSIKIVGSKNFIVPDVEIPLNRELVTVIGGRGSGKSALLESIAFLNEEHTKQDQNNKPKIIEFYRQNIEGKEPAPGFDLEIELIDKDQNKEQHKKSLDDEEGLELPFLYIGQEQLSALATNDRELTEKICELINLDFAELKKTELVEQARGYIANIENTEAELTDLYRKYSDYKDGDFGQWLRKFIEKKEEQKKKLSSKETKDILDDISKATERGLKLKDFKQNLEQLKLDLKNVGLNKQIAALNKALKNLSPEDSVGIPIIDLAPQEKFIEEKQSVIDEEMAKLRALIIEKKNALMALGLKEDISVLIQSAETIEREINNAKKDKTIYEKKLAYLKEMTTTRNRLFALIEEYLNDNTEEIDKKYIEFRGSRDESTMEEKDLFSNIIKDVSVEGTVTFDQNTFAEHLLENCFDKRVVKNIEDVKVSIAKKNEKGGAKDITLENLRKWVEEELDTFLLSDSLNSRGRNNLIDFLFTRWAEFLGVKAIVKLKGVPTEKLSVGQRGTLLLKIYLATATVKQIFIVDQPEDNLDNQFIMNELVPLIRQIKKSRQVILSTHNANLVVNADAEQIIVARLDSDRRDYPSGSIEDNIINTSIKEILEGGEDAFRSRENKYGMGVI
ncbi:MAG: ATPase involved in DNA repair [Candidatus Uhrbacteria bacterium GW2011_GWD2_41_121]|nr:MAG: ATPase involved in DNA repair [Candidatus Uhrbacteria bacterium GW2011_GWD2_41_121]KKS61796.1 MAG: ATPase involved in DNA repair [Candidatus Collierbacteria bacterium GW2011_GWE2_42_48]OGC56278.1 MAG: hypothetical protein A2200_00810 [candidate division WWE3 bacterium RIFOXYA1_FULL_41_11]